MKLNNEKVFGKRFDALNVGLRESRGRAWRFRGVLAVAAIIFAGVSLRKSGSASALLTTITNGGRAEFESVEKAIDGQMEGLTKRMNELEVQLAKADTQATSGAATSMDELIDKLESVLTKILNEDHKVARALENLRIDIEAVVFKPMDFNTWTDLKFPQELARISESNVSDKPQTINDSLADSVNSMDKINDPEQVGNVLREIKGALYVEDCFYLLSISEDAVRAFEGRFVEERDIFESTFDEVMFLERLDLVRISGIN